MIDSDKLFEGEGLAPRKGFRFFKMNESPEGEPESGLVVADTEEEASQLVEAAYGPGWLVDRCTEETHPMKKGIIQMSLAPERSPAMSANELYAMEAKSVSRDPFSFGSVWYELNEESIPEVDGVSINTRVSQRFIYDGGDGYRVTQLSSLWLDENPFAILQEAGRGGRDHQEMYTTDSEVWVAALHYLRSLYELEHPEADVLVDPDQKLRALTCFYSTDTML